MRHISITLDEKETTIESQTTRFKTPRNPETDNIVSQIRDHRHSPLFMKFLGPEATVEITDKTGTIISKYGNNGVFKNENIGKTTIEYSCDINKKNGPLDLGFRKNMFEEKRLAHLNLCKKVGIAPKTVFTGMKSTSYKGYELYRTMIMKKTVNCNANCFNQKISDNFLSTEIICKLEIGTRVYVHSIKRKLPDSEVYIMFVYNEENNIIDCEEINDKKKAERIFNFYENVRCCDFLGKFREENSDENKFIFKKPKYDNTKLLGDNYDILTKDLASKISPKNNVVKKRKIQEKVPIPKNIKNPAAKRGRPPKIVNPNNSTIDIQNIPQKEKLNNTDISYGSDKNTGIGIIPLEVRKEIKCRALRAFFLTEKDKKFLRNSMTNKNMISSNNSNNLMKGTISPQQIYKKRTNLIDNNTIYKSNQNFDRNNLIGNLNPNLKIADPSSPFSGNLTKKNVSYSNNSTPNYMNYKNSIKNNLSSNMNYNNEYKTRNVSPFSLNIPQNGITNMNNINLNSPKAANNHNNFFFSKIPAQKIKNSHQKEFQYKSANSNNSINSINSNNSINSTNNTNNTNNTNRFFVDEKSSKKNNDIKIKEQKKYVMDSEEKEKSDVSNEFPDFLL